MYEVECPGSIGSSACERSTHRCRASLDDGSVGKREAVPLHIVEELELLVWLAALVEVYTHVVEPDTGIYYRCRLAIEVIL